MLLYACDRHGPEAKCRLHHDPLTLASRCSTTTSAAPTATPTWESLGDGVDVEFFSESIAEDELPQRLTPFDVLVLMRERTRLDREVLSQLPNLRLVITTGMRNASLDVDYLLERGVTVCGTQGTGVTPAAGVPSTVEVAWALILAVAKRVTQEDRALRSGRWQLDLPVNLAGATLGLVGLGNLGAAMVGPARAFGMEVVAWSQNLSDERAAEVGVRRVSKEELLAGADFLSIHLVLSDRSRGLIGGPELLQMKPTAALINTSRGPIVDEAALVRRCASASSPRPGSTSMTASRSRPITR